MKLKAVTLFSGGGGSDIGLMAASCEIVGAVEFDAKIAAVYRDNIGDHVQVCRVEDSDPSPFVGIDILAASPSCKSFSVAKVGGEELEGDLSAAEAVCRWIRVTNPRYVIVENVAAYRHSKSFASILAALKVGGYRVRYSLLDAADYGVPQNRRRLILRASRVGPVPDLMPSHCDPKKIAKRCGQTDLFAPVPKPWIGWLEAIADLVPGLPESQFADWQQKRLPRELKECLMVGVQGAGGDLMRTTAKPSPTLTADHAASKHRAFLAHPTADCDRFPCPDGERPAFTITGFSAGMPRAFIVDQTTGEGNAEGERVLGMRGPEKPLFTLTANPNRINIRAYLCSGTDSTVYGAGDPAMTVTSTQGNGTIAHRAFTSGRVVKMTPRALARFQSVPDTYRLPESVGLSATIIGNAVPCKLMEAVVRSLIGAAK